MNWHIEAEKSIIGKMAMDSRALAIACSELSAEDFSPVFAEAFKVLKGCNRIGKEGNALFIDDNPESLKTLVNDAIEYAVGPSDPSYPIEIIKRMSAKRRALARIAEAQEALNSSLDSWESASMIVRSLADSWHDGTRSRLVPISEIALRDDEQRGVPIGYGKELDSVTGCGYPCGQVTGIAAFRKGGKSTFMLGSYLAQAGRRAVYATFADLDPEKLKRRALKHHCGMGGTPKVRLDKLQDYDDALSTLNDPYGDHAEHLVYDGIRHGRDVETFAGAMLSEHGKKPIDIIFVDYIQRVTSREMSPRFGRTALMEHVSDQLAELAAKLSCPVVVGSQITKGADGEWKTKYATALEEDVGLMLKLQREDGEEHAEVTVTLNRFGRQGLKMPFRFDDERCRFVPR